VFAREFWKRIESIHAVTYFAPESTEAARAAGLRGFWMGYFGFRAAPLGPVSAGVVEAAFANFETAMIQRSIPDAWAELHHLARASRRWPRSSAC
jgi:cyanate permease